MSEQSIMRVLNALGCDNQRTSWTVSCPMPNHGKVRGDRNPSSVLTSDEKGSS